MSVRGCSTKVWGGLSLRPFLGPKHKRETIRVCLVDPKSNCPGNCEIGRTFEHSVLIYFRTPYSLFHYQAAIGSIALDRVRESDPVDPDSELYGVTVLCIAVLAIIVTSPPGAALISLLGPRLLDHKPEEIVPIKDGESSDGSVAEEKETSDNV